MKHVPLLILLACLIYTVPSLAQNAVSSLAELPVVNGQFSKSPDTVVCAEPFPGAYKLPDGNVEFALNRRFTQLTCVVAMHDGASTHAGALVVFSLDGRAVARTWLYALNEGVPFTFSVANAIRLGISIEGRENYGDDVNVRILQSALVNVPQPPNPTIIPLIDMPQRYGTLTLSPYQKIGGNTLRAYYMPESLAYDLNKQYNTFSCVMALADTASTDTWLKVGIYLDGTEAEVREITVQQPQRVDLNVQNAVRMEIKTVQRRNYGDDKYLFLINPVLNRGNTPAFLCDYCGKPFGSKIELDSHVAVTHINPPPPGGGTTGGTDGGGTGSGPKIPATFVVDPKDLDQLAESLRRQIDAKSEVKERLAEAKIAISTFKLVDIASPSVADNVAEDLSTSLLKTDFTTIERGQLDKVLKELKVQDSAMIDPETAVKIGELAGCDIVMVGSISDRGQFIVINARFLETATGKTVAAERVEGRKIPIQR